MSDTPSDLDRFLHAIADRKRREILRALKERSGAEIGKEIGLSASDIESRVQLSQPTVSHHMAVLSRAGLVQGRKLGHWVWYRRNEKTLRQLARKLRQDL